MAFIHRSTASLRVMGHPLVPEEITAIFGVEPSWSQRKGDRVPSYREGQFLTVWFDVWALDASEREPENLDEQVQEILGRLPSDLGVWSELGHKYKLNLFCGLFMSTVNEGFLISPQTLISLGQRGIELDGDLYAP